MAATAGRLAFIGFGEAAMAFLEGWGAERSGDVAAYDIKTDSAATQDAMRARYEGCRVTGAANPEGALADARAVFCVVTADQALEAARTAAAFLQADCFWFDCNSCAPGTKREAAELIEAAGGRYVDVAVMAPVRPKLHRVPMLLSGPHADRGAEVLRGLGMCPEISGGEVGRASSVKMMRSVMVKGLEALTAECLLAARRAGVEAEVLASLEASDPDIAWRTRAAYNLERMMVHGTRRAAEMEEVAKTVAALGLPDAMSRAATRWQASVGALGAEPGEAVLETRADRILDRL
ncbi:DUF1932 domain-containing protein [Roseibacterium sp. SDUM158016]|uniref:NAD(P)-dependent oxidoreductase n=1 Tax=Roseicyclus sediminis TaxID=2980997 RepID=UPI0021CEAA54|nr:NAD(P)-dependent oxidoreductase [Roseibacterium sp. SDUM158016]MCU4653717.1 DUF1932 domain-containing protein [Roseibacterium sp. SDUM158016]